MRFVVAFLTPSIQLASLLLIKYTKRDTASPQSLCSGVPSLWNVFTSDLRVVSHGFSLAFFRSLWKYALLGETFPDHFFKMSWIPSYPLIPLPLCVILFKNLSPLMNSHICAEKCTCHICTVDAFWQSEHVYWTALPDRELEHPHRRSTHPLAHALLLSSIAMKCSAGFWILYKQNYIAYIHLCLACLISYFHYSVGSIIWVYSCCVVLFCFFQHGAILNSTTVNMMVQVFGCVYVFLLGIEWKKKISGAWHTCMSNFLILLKVVVRIYTPASGIWGFQMIHILSNALDDESFKFSRSSLLWFFFF